LAQYLLLPDYHAEQDDRLYTEYADFLKPAIYGNPAGERMASSVDSLTQIPRVTTNPLSPA